MQMTKRFGAVKRRDIIRALFLTLSWMFMDFFISSAHAQAQTPAQPSPFGPLIMLVVFFVIFYFIVIRPQSRRAKEHRAMIDALAKGDEVITSGGIAGRVVELGENFTTVEIAPNTHIRVQRGAISAVLPKGSLK
jgi:preprotein translocase subunit YajC